MAQLNEVLKACGLAGKILNTNMHDRRESKLARRWANSLSKVSCARSTCGNDG